MGRGPIRVFIIDDHAVLRDGLRVVIDIQPGMVVVGEAATRDQALANAPAALPDVILLDLDLGDGDEDGLSLLPDLLTVVPDARIILLTGIRDPEAHRRAVLLGALGLVLKEKASQTVIHAIEKVHAGEVWLDRGMIASILNERSRGMASQPYDAEAEKIARLTEREREVVALVGDGLRNKQIADQLVISEATVRHHLTSIFAKLGVEDRFELAIYAYRHGLAKLPQ